MRKWINEHPYLITAVIGLTIIIGGSSIFAMWTLPYNIPVLIERIKQK